MKKIMIDMKNNINQAYPFTDTENIIGNKINKINKTRRALDLCADCHVVVQLLLSSDICQRFLFLEFYDRLK